MAAPNAQPCGSRPGPAAVHEHAPNQGPMPPGGFDTSDVYDNGAAVAGHGTPKPVGNGKKNPLR